MKTDGAEMPPKAFPYRQGSPWLGVDRRADHEDFIAGNREGLEALREAIDHALQYGKAEIDIPYTDFPGVVLVDDDPRRIDQEKPKITDWMAGIFSFLLIPALFLACTVLAILLFKSLKKMVLG